MRLKNLFHLLLILLFCNMFLLGLSKNASATQERVVGIVKEDLVSPKEIQIFVKDQKVLVLKSFDDSSFEKIRNEADKISYAINQFFGTSKGVYDPSTIKFLTEDKYFCCYVGDEFAFKVSRSQAFLQNLSDNDITNTWLVSLQRSLGYNPSEDQRILYAHKYYLKEFVQEGIASWYGSNLAGRYMSNGEIFYPSNLTAAHRWLPLGSLVLVTNEDNGESVVVTITDRMGSRSRIIDLSEGAAERIGILSSGLAPVKIDLLK